MHNDLSLMVNAADPMAFARHALAIGPENRYSNYSAYDHGLGKLILSKNRRAPERVVELAQKFAAMKTGREVPHLIREADLKYLKISVGSELATMMNPRASWVTNSRSMWANLLIKHGDNVQKASEELRLYKDGELDSEMEYQKWAELHFELDVTLTRLVEMSEPLARLVNVNLGPLKYLTADAIADSLYVNFSGVGTGRSA